MLKNVLLLFSVCVAFSLTMQAGGIDAPIDIVCMEDYFRVRQELEKDLSQDDYPRFLEAIDFVMRETDAALSRVSSSTKGDVVFCLIVNRKTPREIIVLGSLLGLETCDMVRLENEALSKDNTDQEKIKLYRLRAQQAEAMRSLYLEVISKYTKGVAVRACPHCLLDDPIAVSARDKVLVTLNSLRAELPAQAALDLAIAVRTIERHCDDPSTGLSKQERDALCVSLIDGRTLRQVILASAAIMIAESAELSVSVASMDGSKLTGDDYARWRHLISSRSIAVGFVRMYSRADGIAEGPVPTSPTQEGSSRDCSH